VDTTHRRIPGITIRAAAVLAATFLQAHEAMAGGNLATPADGVWKSECGSCHIAYPPALLPAAAWKRLMSGLDRHFGADATLDAGAAAQIGAYLERYSGPDRRRQAAPGSLRITEAPWFVHEHGEVPAATWRHPAVRSAANCAACHALAEQGDFRERNIRIPR
jgi:Dihaem cytochrome c